VPNISATDVWSFHQGGVCDAQTEKSVAKNVQRPGLLLRVANGKRVWLGKVGAEVNRNYKTFINDLTKEPPTFLLDASLVSQRETGISNVLIAKLCADLLKEREGKVSFTQWDCESRVIAVLVSLYDDIEAVTCLVHLTMQVDIDELLLTHLPLPIRLNADDTYSNWESFWAGVPRDILHVQTK